MGGVRSGRRGALAACALVVAAAAALRLPGLASDLWLDEIWTWATARGLDSAAGVFRDVHDSNNNHLNTLWFYAVSGADRAALYRLPAYLAGVAGVVLAAALAWRRDPLEAVLAALLVGASFPLIHFSSEARGYAPAVALALAALWLLERDRERPRPATALGFGLCVSLGLLFHLVFLFFWAGALAWSARRIGRDGIRSPLRLHALPAAVLALLAATDLRHWALGGGDPTDAAALTARSVGFALGLPVERSLAWPYAALAAALVGAGLRARRRAGDDLVWLYAVAIAVAPALAIGVLRPQVVALRYFLIPISLTLLLAAPLLARALRAGGARRALGTGLLGLYLVGNGIHTAAFLEHGRGGYRDALSFMASHSGPEVVVASDHDFRTGRVLAYYARRLAPGSRLDYRRGGLRAASGAEWFVRHRARRPAAPPAQLRDAAGRRYALAAEFDHAAISGFYWAVYRVREPEAAASPALREPETAASPAPRRRSSTMPKPSAPKGSGPMRSTGS